MAPAAAKNRSRFMVSTRRKELQWSGAGYHGFDLIGKRQGQELIQVLLEILDSRARPVGPPNHPVCDFSQPGEVLEQFGGRNSRELQVYPLMPPQYEKSFVHPQGPSTMGHYDGEIGEIDRHVIQLHRMAVLRPGTGENAGAGVDQDR